MSEEYAFEDLCDASISDKHDALCPLEERVKQLDRDWPLTDRTRRNLMLRRTLAWIGKGRSSA